MSNEKMKQLEGLDPGSPEFKAIQEEIMEEFFATVEDPEAEQRMRAMHNGIQMDLDRYKNPTARYNRMVEVFWQGFHKFKDSVEMFQGVLEGKEPEPVETPPKATIMEFKKK